MVETIVSVILLCLKSYLEFVNKKKLSDEEFLAYIDAHQKKRTRLAENATDTEDALKEIEKRDS